LLHDAGIAWHELDEVLLTGGFGASMNISSAIGLGILPALKKKKIRKVQNAAGRGAILFLIKPALRNKAARIAERIEHLELATHPMFSSTFARFLCFNNRSTAA
jgi:uncharacterized 2Fe-2S/4Fe-4S cluster protein (DUF4445 family)